MSDMPLCKCGCGTPVERKTKKYFADHYKNPVGPPKEVKVETKTVAKKAPVQKKAFKRKLNEGLISKKNLQSVGLSIYTC